jgi:hypothetical protein
MSPNPKTKVSFRSGYFFDFPSVFFITFPDGDLPNIECRESATTHLGIVWATNGFQ